MLVEQYLLLLTLLPAKKKKKKKMFQEPVATQNFQKSCEKKNNLKPSLAMNCHRFVILV